MTRLLQNLCLTAIVFLRSCVPCPAAVSADDATNAIVGEAAASPIVMLGVADAIHNRDQVFANPLRGVYGFNARHNATETRRTWQLARLAWDDTAADKPNHGIVRGAIYFGNARDVAKGTFAGMTLTCVLGDERNRTYFFKP